MNHTMFQLSRIVTVVLLLAGALAIPSRMANANGAGATFTITTTSDADSVSDEVCTLREAMQSVLNEADYHECTHTGSFGDDLIVFSISGSTTITLLANLPALAASALTIDGSNPGSPVVIDGANAYKPFHILSGSSLTMQNITVQHGYFAGVGGGVENSGTLTVLKSSFQNNVATSTGGAIMNMGTIIVANTTFSGNQGSSGGGLANNSTGTASILNSTFSGNAAVGIGGGGGAISNTGTVTIANSTFSGNQAAAFGGGLENNSGTATIFNSTFSGNTATVAGGALDTYDGALPPITTVKNTVMANSSPPTTVDCSSTGSTGTLTGDHNIIETTAGGIHSCSGITISTADPMLGSLVGSPAYLPLLPGSPALEAGDDTTCSTAPVSSRDQRDVPRPQGPHCDLGAFELEPSITLKSVGAQDGWLLESSETSGKAATWDSTATQFYLGDDAANKQYRGILSFDTSALPDTAVITGITLKIKKTGLVGANPFSNLGNIIVDVKKGPFSGNPALQLTDFYAAGSKNYITKFTNNPVSNWYSTTLGSGSYGYINLTGPTQFRLRFATDDNNNHVADYLKFGSGNAIASSRPVLSIAYYVP